MDASPPLTATRPAAFGLSDAFDAVPGYLNAASLGLPPRATVEALRTAVDDWAAGRARAADFDVPVNASRAAYARIVGVDAAQVAVGNQVSVTSGLVAASLPDGAEVVTVDGDFTSVTFPFLVHADRGVTVRHVPLHALADEVRPSTALVAFSLVQSADGRIADAPAVVEAARRVGALTYCDLTQAVGWLPVRAGDFDVTACGAYKWLCSPRGTAFTTVGPAAAAALRPLHAGWYAGASPWTSVYGPQMHLADDARRFDLSPAWLAWAGTAPALELFAAADPAAVHAHAVGLADAFLAELDLPPRGSAIVALPDPDADLQRRLAAAGCVVAGRAGRARLAFHAWNTPDDVRRAATAARPTSARGR